MIVYDKIQTILKCGELSLICRITEANIFIYLSNGKEIKSREKYNNPLGGIGYDKLVNEYKDNGLKLKNEFSKSLCGIINHFLDENKIETVKSICFACIPFYQQLLTIETEGYEEEYISLIKKINVDEAYFVPSIGGFLGGDFVVECLRYPKNTMVVELGKTLKILYDDGEKILCSSLYPVEDNHLGHCIQMAAINEFLQDDKLPYIRLYGISNYELNNYIVKKLITATNESKDMDILMRFSYNMKYFAAADQFVKKCTIVNIALSNSFQQKLSSLY